MILCGIDPGLGGAVAFYDPATADSAIYDTPVLTVARGKTKRRDLDGHALLRLLVEYAPGHCFLEQAQAMPKQSAYATGIFFQVYGEIRGLLIGRGVPMTIVHPATWKRALGVPAGKDGARARASQLLPEAAWQWPLKKHDGRAEAAMLVLYGYQSFRAIAEPPAAKRLVPRQPADERAIPEPGQ